tara:strand:+ start:187 stop:1215 length:1029 start_codon:yes stop_codon:yes gene_type:complete
MITAFSDADCASTTHFDVYSPPCGHISTQTFALQFSSLASGTDQPPKVGTQTEVINSDKGEDRSSQNTDPLLIDLALGMKRELELRDDAFDDFAPLSTAGDHDITHKYVLTCNLVDKTELQCVDLSWNSTGSMICAAFGRPDKFGWCDDSGIICCWSLFRGDFCPSKATHILEYASCFTVVTCHPTHPSLLAAGTFNGEILIYDLTSTHDSLKASSDIDEYFHREPITALLWLHVPTSPGSKQGSYQLASLSGDGKVLWWSLETIENASREAGGCLPHPVGTLLILHSLFFWRVCLGLWNAHNTRGAGDKGTCPNNWWHGHGFYPISNSCWLGEWSCPSLLT